MKTVLELEGIAEILDVSSQATRFEVEIGCGNGHFIAEHSAANPDSFLMGVEIKRKRCVKSLKKVANRANVAIVCARAEDLIALLPENSVDAFHIYYPDPWPKSRHRRRRFFTLQNLQRLKELLRLGGSIYFATDFFDYYLQAKLLLALHPGLTLSSTAAPRGAEDSLFGYRLRDAGRGSFRLCSIKS